MAVGIVVMKRTSKIAALFSPSAVSKKLFKRYSSVGRDGETLNPHWHREAVGGMWEEIGELQFQFMVQQGLRPDHHMLDVGCGSLRGGIHFVRYLDPGHYCGIDINQALLDAGLQELEHNDLLHKNPVLTRVSGFEFSLLGRRFDYVLAQSVFTHLPVNDIVRCVMNVQGVLVPGGRFYATFFENAQGKYNLDPISHPRADGPPIVTHFDQDPYHYDVETFRWMCKRTSLRVEYIGEWGHPRDQRMLLLIKGD